MSDMSGKHIDDFLAKIPDEMLQPPWSTNETIVKKYPVSSCFPLKCDGFQLQLKYEMKYNSV